MTPSFMGRTAMTPSGVRPSMRLAEHAFGFETNTFDLACGAINRDDGRLIEHDPFAFDVDQGVRGAEVDGNRVRGKERSRFEGPAHLGGLSRVPDGTQLAAGRKVHGRGLS